MPEINEAIDQKAEQCPPDGRNTSGADQPPGRRAAGVSTRQVGSSQAAGRRVRAVHARNRSRCSYSTTCGQGSAVRESRRRFERDLRHMPLGGAHNHHADSARSSRRGLMTSLSAMTSTRRAVETGFAGR